ncbi:mitochondrial ribosomal protein var1 [Plasmodium yoelii yoelii]|nr:mitochondrial ribosomal protein var1 [Plasmodium yoelii yoelii]
MDVFQEQDIIDQININKNKKLPFFKLNINNNNILVQNFHIKSIPLIQLRHKNKLVCEISGNELNNKNELKEILQRYHSYFTPLNYVYNINDFLLREDELLKEEASSEQLQNYKSKSIPNDINKETIPFEIENVSNEKNDANNNIILNDHNKMTYEGNTITKDDILNNMHIKYKCSSYVTFKKLEMLINQKIKNLDNIKLLLNEIFNNHISYISINEHYSKIATRAFLCLFENSNINDTPGNDIGNFLSIEKLIELKKNLENNNDLDSIRNDLKLINFNEPIMSLDNFKNLHLKKIKNIEELLSENIDKNKTNTLINDPNIIHKENHIVNNTNKIKKNKEIDNIKIIYLSRIYRILAIKYLDIKQHDNSMDCALESYKLTFPLKNIDTKKSKILIENLILYLGAYNSSVITFLSKLQFSFTDKIFKVVKFPHTRAIKGGRPMMKRGKSGKWLWLSQDWKPRWIKKKTKQILEEEWKCVPDKNVPFWN